MLKNSVVILLIASALSACGGQCTEEEEKYPTCITRAVRSNAINLTEHSTNNGITWLSGACTS